MSDHNNSDDEFCWTKIFIEPFPDEDEDEEAAAVYDAVLSVSQVDLRPSMYGAFMGQLPTVTSTEDATEETGAGAVSPLTFADLATVSPEAIAELCDVACAEYAPGQTDAGTGSPITRTVSPEVIAEECSTADGVEGDKDEDYSVGVNLSKIVPAPRSLRKKPKISYAALAGLGKVGRPKESVHQKKKRSKAHAESAEPKVKLPKRRSSTKVSKRKTNVSNVEKTNLLDQNLLIHEAQPNISPGSISRRRSNISYEEECSDYSEEEAKRKSVPAKIVKRSKSTVSRVEKDPTFKIKAQRRHSTANVPNPPLAAARNLRLRSNISYYESSISSDESGSTVELKAKYLREDPGVNVSSTTTAINAAFLALQDSATGSPGQLTISKIVENRFPDLLGTTKEVTSEPAEFKETFGLAGPSSHPELIAKYSQDPDPFPQARSDDPPTQSAKMINSKRSPARKDVRKDVKEMKSEPKSKNKKKKPVAPKAQRNNKKGNRNSGCTRAVKPKITETTIAHNRLRLFDTTPTGEEDPYQLGEADMREQSPIPKLMFNKQSRPRRSSTRYNSPHENATQYSVGYGRTPKQKSAVSEDQDEDVDVEVVRTDPLDSDPDWCANNEKNFTYRYKRTTSPMLNADALQPENLAISNSATLDHMDYTVARPVAQVKNEEAAANKRATSGRGRKRASSSPGVPKRGKRKPCTVKQTRVSTRAKVPTAPGITTDAAYNTVIGEGDQYWFQSFEPGTSLDFLEETKATVEVPQWRIKNYSPRHYPEGIEENMDEKVIEKRHKKLEFEERRQLRWHMRRLREQRHVERLRQRHKDSCSSAPVSAPSVYTLWPRPQDDLQMIEIVDELPVGALGEDVPALSEAQFSLPWVRRSQKPLRRSKRSKTLH